MPNLTTTGIPPGGNAPVDEYSRPLLPVGRGTDINDGHSYAKPIQPQTGPVDTNTIPKPGSYLPNNDNGGVQANDQQQFPPTDVIPDDWQRQKSLEHYDIMPIPIDGPSTEVVRPIQQSNYSLPSPRWTAHSAPPVFRYTREFAQRYNATDLPGYLQNDGSHFSMAQSYDQNGWITTKRARPMTRNNIVPRNVPTPLDDQVTNTANRSQKGTVFTSFTDTEFIPS